MARNTEEVEHEEVSSTNLTVKRGENNAVMIGGVLFEMVKRVNVPTLKHESGDTIVIRAELPIRTEIQTGENEGKEINILRVTELTTGTEFEYVCNAITADVLEGAYPDKAYVGKSFAITKLGTVAGKRYKEVDVVEIQPKK